MSNTNENILKGKLSETLAFEYLELKGFKILELNWRHKKAEIDIIAQDGRFLVFIEVKSRSSDFFGPPEVAVNKKKKLMLIAGATSYMEAKDYCGEIRFDIISIILKSKSDFSIEHFPDAFFPGL